MARISVIKTLVAAGLVLLCVTSAGGQDNITDLYTRFYNIREIGQVNEPGVNALYQDQNGFVWVGTDDGLLRYDGYEFFAYHPVPGDSLSLSSSAVNTISGDNDGGMWVGTDNGLNWYDRANDRFERYMFDPADQRSIRHNHIRKLFPEREGLILVETLDGTLTIFDRNGNTTRHFSHDPVRQPYYRYHALYQDDEGYIWFGGRSLGLHRLDPVTGNIADFPADSQRSDRKRENDISLVHVGDDGQWYVAGLDGLYRFFPERGDFERILGTTSYYAVNDPEGNVWVGTGNGLVKVDNSSGNLVHFRHNRDIPWSITGNRVNVVMADRDGNIWAGTDSGLSFLSHSHRRFRNYTGITGEPRSLSSGNITALHEDSSGRLWIGTMDGGLNRWDEESGDFIRYSASGGQLAADYVSALYEDTRGDIWVGLWAGMGFNRFDSRSGSFSRYAIDPDSRARDWFNDFYEDPDGNFWLGVWGSRGLLGFDRETGIISENSFIGGYIPNSHAFRSAIVSGGYIFSADQSPGMVSRYDLQSKNFLTAVRMDFYVPPNQTERFMRVFPEDARLIQHLEPAGEGRFIAASDNMIFMMDHSLRIVAVAPSDTINALGYCIDTDEVAVLHPSGVSVYDSDLIKTSSYGPGIRLTGPGDSDSITVVYDDDLSFSFSAEAGQQHIEGLRCLSDERLSLISLVIPLEDGGLLVASGTELLIVKCEEGFIEIINRPDRQSLTSHLITAIAGEKDGTMWVGTSDGGLNRVSACRDSIIHFTAEGVFGADGPFVGKPVNIGDRFPDNAITSLYFDADSNLWVGTESCLVVIDRITGTYERVGEEWPVGGIAFIMSDADGVLWVGTEGGLVRYHHGSGEWRLFTQSDGLPSSVFNRAAAKRLDGTLVFGTRAGMTIIDPAHFTDEPGWFPARISFVEVLGKRIRTTFAIHDTIIIDHTSNYLTIGYSTLSYHHPPLTRFYYKMAGLSDTWMESRGNTASFTSLPPGTYRFQLSSYSNGGTGNSDSTLTVIVRPPFHQSLWFRLLLFLVVAGGITAMVAIYIHQLKLRHRSAKFEQRLLLSQMNPHFVFNSLSAIQSYIYTSDAAEASDYLSDFSRLMRLILENSRSEEVPLSREVQALKLYFRLQKLRFFDKFDYEVVVDPAIVMQQVMIPPMLIQPFIENSIEHGMLHKQEKGLITLKIRSQGSYLEVIITDDGVGIKKSAEINIIRKRDHVSMATSITNERLHNLIRRGSKRAGLEITDRMESEGISGTRVVLAVPYTLREPAKDNGINDVIFRED
ncbi:MAG: two-component regulator propeller domain-containing protein [Bacteroidales bacterium]